MWQSSWRRPRRLSRGAGVVLAVAALALATTRTSTGQTAATPSRPSLVVLVVVDQMRAEYLTRYQSLWTSGFKRLLAEGAHYDNAFYPYLNTVTCAGHATLGTGAVPATHGIILNQWYRRELNAMKPCTFDPAVRTWTYGGGSGGDGHSAVALKVPTLAQRLREAAPESRSVTFSVKARSAIMMAGAGATAVTWLGGRGWQTSSAFGGRHPEVARAIRRRPLEDDRTAVWERLLPTASYSGIDEGRGERPIAGRTAVFPHPHSVRGPGTFLERWEESPASDAYLGALASDAVDALQLGQRDVVDFLGVSFSATDLVGHSHGPDSHEVQDVLARLDRTLGTLLDALDRRVGPDRYVLALSADHGVAQVPEVSVAAGQGGGRVPLGVVRAKIEAALAPLGPGPHVARAENAEIYLTAATRAKMTGAAVAPALAQLRAMPGIAAAVWTPSLASTADASPEVVRAIRASHVPERSGDITIVQAPNWVFVLGSSPTGGDATTHGSLHAYDQHVPLIFLGRPFRPGHYDRRVSPADLAPTLAATVGVTMPGVEGRPLEEARVPRSEGR